MKNTSAVLTVRTNFDSRVTLGSIPGSILFTSSKEIDPVIRRRVIRLPKSVIDASSDQGIPRLRITGSISSEEVNNIEPGILPRVTRLSKFVPTVSTADVFFNVN